MGWLIFLIPLFFISPGIAFSCDCTIVPFKPDPPCFDICTAKYLAIATASDLEKIVGVDPKVAQILASVPKNVLPRKLEGYRSFLSEKEFQNLKSNLKQLSRQDFELIRNNAVKQGKGELP